MPGRRLEPAERRELVRLIDEEGLSPRAAAGRLGVSETTARRWHARRQDAGPGALGDGSWAAAAPRAREHDLRADAEASIREAEAMLAALFAPAVRRPRPCVPPAREQRPRVPASVAPLAARLERPVRLRTWTRRQAGGVAITLAFVPVGWIATAAVGPERRLPLAPATADPAAPAQTFSPRAATAELPRGTSLVAYARRSRQGIGIYRHSKDGRPYRRLRPRRLEGKRLPLVFLVRSRKAGRLRVYLPVRPNLSRGWIRARDVRLARTSFRVRIELARHRLTVLRAARVLARERVGIGRSISPTPTGRYYVTDLIRARDPEGIYGPFAFGLSGHSPVFTSFGSGDGQIGLHGTNAPGALGTDVSSGCIRVSNSVIRRLAKTLPLGTPVDIV